MTNQLWKKFKDEERKFKLNEKMKTLEIIANEISLWENGTTYTLFEKIAPIDELHNYMFENKKRLKISDLEASYKVIRDRRSMWVRETAIFSHFFIEFSDGRIIKVIKHTPMFGAF